MFVSGFMFILRSMFISKFQEVVISLTLAFRTDFPFALFRLAFGLVNVGFWFGLGGLRVIHLVTWGLGVDGLVRFGGMGVGQK